MEQALGKLRGEGRRQTERAGALLKEWEAMQKQSKL